MILSTAVEQVGENRLKSIIFLARRKGSGVGERRGTVIRDESVQCCRTAGGKVKPLTAGSAPETAMTYAMRLDKLAAAADVGAVSTFQRPRILTCACHGEKREENVCSWQRLGQTRLRNPPCSHLRGIQEQENIEKSFRTRSNRFDACAHVHVHTFTLQLQCQSAERRM
ncbi:hypothetical protein FGB62_319g07 [Gracilaria domingensis]|nr:hypothetical protein FGB62_319g07 [Gracilaria domingensis]